MTKSSVTDCYLGADCRGPKYHVCLAGKPDTFPELLRREMTLVPASQKTRTYVFTEEHRLAISSAQELRWEKYHAENREQYEKMEEDYRNGMSMRGLEAKYGISRPTVQKIIARAAAEGKLEVRPPGAVVATTN